MRILVADQNALLLAAVASTFGRHCVVVTATQRESCLEHLAQGPFDVVVACERLRDYTGLELLSEIETLAPQTLCIFSASAPRLAQLQSQLDHFRLLGTLSYPIDARKLLVALKVARTKLAARPKVRHVVLESEWDTGERLGILERELEVAPAEPPTLSPAPIAAPVRERPNIPVASIPTVGTTPAARRPESTPVPAAAVEADDIPILDNVEETSVSTVRWVNKPSAEESFEVSYDENPSRLKAAAPTRVTATPAAPVRGPEPPSSRPTRPTGTGTQAGAGQAAATGHAAAPDHRASTGHAAAPDHRAATGHAAVPDHRASAGHAGPTGHPASTGHAGPLGQRASGDHTTPTGRSAPKAQATPHGTARPTARSVSAGQPGLASDTHAEETFAPSFDVMAASLGAPANDPSVEPPPPPPPPPIDTGGAANEPAFDSDKAGKNPAKPTVGKSADDESDPQKSSAGSSGAGNSASRAAAGAAKANAAAGGAADAKSQPVATAKKPAGTAAKKSADGPHQRKQAVPTAAQRAAFQRAKARRHAVQNGFSIEEADTNSPPSLQAGGTASTPNALRTDWPGTRSLTDLARMATHKRPLGQTQAKFAPKRNVVMVGSGVAAVVLASVLAFQLTRSHAPTHRGGQAAAAQLFTPNANEVAQNDASGPPPEVFGPPPGQTQQVAAAANPTSNLPQPQTFDPNTAPADPPPPPALEHPGPMEPPSASHYEQPPGSE